MYRFKWVLYFGNWQIGWIESPQERMFEYAKERDCLILRLGRILVVRYDRYGYRA